jgi:ABC-type amino acid transport substrate-binding protein
MICSHCRSKVPAGAHECPNCGSAEIVTAGASSSSSLRGPIVFGVLAASAVGALMLAAVVLLALFSGAPMPGDEAVAETVAAPTGGFAAVKQRGKLRIAADPASPPFLAREGEAWTGFEGALMQAIAGTVGVPFEVVPAEFEDLTAKVASGEADLAIGQLSAAVKWPGVTWSSSYLQYSYCLVGAKENAPNPATATINVYDDPIAKALARRLNPAGPKVVDNTLQLVEPAVIGQALALYDCPIARHDLAVFYDKHVEIKDDLLGLATYNVAVAENDDQMRQDVDRVLRDLGNQGLLAKLAERWIPGSAVTETTELVVVQPGEDLAAVAARALGDAGQAEALYGWNADILGSDKGALYAGMALRIQK